MPLGEVLASRRGLPRCAPRAEGLLAPDHRVDLKPPND
jgi:hypothetical protein